MLCYAWVGSFSFYTTFTLSKVKPMALSYILFKSYKFYLKHFSLKCLVSKKKFVTLYFKYIYVCVCVCVCVYVCVEGGVYILCPGALTRLTQYNTHRNHKIFVKYLFSIFLKYISYIKKNTFLILIISY